MSSKTPPLLTPTTIATISPMKKILLQTHQMATKTEDSLVFSWEGRDIYHFSFHIYSGHFLLDVLFFSFSRLIFRVLLLSWSFIYMFALYIPGSLPFSSYFDAFGQFSLYSQKRFHGTTFSLCAIPSQMPRSQRFLAMMNCSEPFLFLLILCFAPMYCAFLLSFCSLRFAQVEL